MTTEWLRGLALVAFVVGLAILISNCLKQPNQAFVLKPRVVKTIMIDPDTEIEKQEGWN